MRMSIEDYAEYLSEIYLKAHGPLLTNCKKSCGKFQIGFIFNNECMWNFFKFGGHCLGKGSWYNIMGADLPTLEKHVLEFFNNLDNKPK